MILLEIHVKIKIVNNIIELINTYAFQLIKINLQRSMQMFCMDEATSEALMALKLVC